MIILNNKQLQTAVMVICTTTLLLVVSCKKTEPESNSTQGSASALNENNPIEGLLNNFWANYSAYHNVAIEDGRIPNLNGSSNETEMLNTLHYALNTAITNPDTVYEEVIEQELKAEIPVAENNTFKNSNICQVFDEVVTLINNKVAATEFTEKAINSIEVELSNYTATKAMLTIRVRFSGGALYATSNLEWTSNSSPYLAKFQGNYQIPWVSQTTLTQSKVTDYYQYIGHLLNNRWSVTNYDVSILQPKVPIGQAAHDVLSVSGTYWTDPRLNPPAVTSNYKAVVSPNSLNHVIKLTNLAETPSFTQPPQDKINPYEVHVTCGNPSTPNMPQGAESASDIMPSALLSYYDSEHKYGLNAIRNVTGVQMNFLWRNRKRIVEVGFDKRSNQITDNLAKFGFGFYGLNKITYIAHAWPQPYLELNQCLFIRCQTASSNNFWTMCKFQEDYRPDLEFAHYSYQKLPPLHWRNFTFVRL